MHELDLDDGPGSAKPYSEVYPAVLKFRQAGIYLQAMDRLFFSDPAIAPDQDSIAGALAGNARLWNSFFKEIHDAYPDFVESWRHYKDARGWLLNVSRRGKTVFWLGVYDGWFRTTFYLSQRAEEAVAESALPENLKRQFSTRAIAKLRCVSVTCASEVDIADAMLLIGIKLAMK